MELKIIRKHLGEVEIWEFLEPRQKLSVRNQGEDFSKVFLPEVAPKALFLNGFNFHQFDVRGIEMILQKTNRVRKRAFLLNNPPEVGGLLDRAGQPGLSIFQDEVEVGFFFSHEFARNLPEGSGDGIERRQFRRLDTVLPAHLHWTKDGNKKFQGFAVVTDLSEGGLFARFIESRTADRCQEHFVPSRSEPVEMNLYVSRKQFIPIAGRVVRYDGMQGGIAIEFQNVGDWERKRLGDWLSAQDLFQDLEVRPKNAAS